MIDTRFAFEAIGTSWVIDIYDPAINPQILRQKIDKEIREFTSTFSRFDKNAQIFKKNLSGGKIALPEKYLELIKTYKKLYELTRGLFTPLIGTLLSDAGYDENYSLTPKKLRPVLKWEEVIKFVPPCLEIKKGSVLDFGAGGKGFLVDLISKLFEKENINDYCIDAGGDILQKGKEKLKVGLEHPDDPKKVIGIAEIRNQSICASSGNRRKWNNFHHIFDPFKLESVKSVLAVWVIAENALNADCLATCLFLDSPDKFEKDFNFEYLILYPDYTINKSEKFISQIYYN